MEFLNSEPYYASKKLLTSRQIFRYAVAARTVTKKALTVESCTVVVLLTFILIIIISFPSPTLSFSPDLKPSVSANHSHCSLLFLLQKYDNDVDDLLHNVM